MKYIAELTFSTLYTKEFKYMYIFAVDPSYY